MGKYINKQKKVSIIVLKKNYKPGKTFTLTPEEEILMITLSEFPYIVRDAADKLMPNLIANYLARLAEQFNLFYEKHSVMKSDQSLKQSRIALTAACAQVMKNGMILLGMVPLERM